MLELSHKDFKAVLITVLHKVKKNTLEMIKTTWILIRGTSYKKKKNQIKYLELKIWNLKLIL